MKKTQEIEYIFSHKTQTDSDIEFEKKNIEIISPPSVSFSYLDTYYATFSNLGFSLLRTFNIIW